MTEEDFQNVVNMLKQKDVLEDPIISKYYGN